ncbi:hypothetical protein SAMN04488564_1011023 [Lentzea waywayandensis]|uniref:Uncharacterized protein n=1 Tax=Lentzea waywayandensis TaxID=84724 RepID=A0A1I6D3W4_9PSEU|nr:hypothetical protein SAMN04488564_1011023 [Lentzea waywayandensis]
MAGPLQRLQPVTQVVAFLAGEAGADVPDVDQVTGVRVVRAEQQTPTVRVKPL